MLPRTSYLLSRLVKHKVSSHRIAFSRIQRNVHQYRAGYFAEVCSKPTSKIQIYSSLSNNPFFNLAVEHYLLQNTPPDSTILLFYVNKPCVVIGRNQNPWLEANLRYMSSNPVKVSSTVLDEERPGIHYVKLVRRRSGGGAVFHDLQNINYSVIRHSSDFTRDKSVEMVVKAIRKDNPRARVNERHDIVLDTGSYLEEKDFPDPKDMHRTCFAPSDVKDGRPLKVSGSAYKLTRNRSLHHGTCLLNSPNLQELSKYLNPPSRPFISAKGVDSVRSPVTNIYDASGQVDHRPRFERRVSGAFLADCNLHEDVLHVFGEDRGMRRLEAEGNWVAATFDETLAQISEIGVGMEELKSPEWLYGQTPQFTVSTHPSKVSNLNDLRFPSLPIGVHLELSAKSGVIQSAQIKLDALLPREPLHTTDINKELQGLKIHQIDDFTRLLAEGNASNGKELRSVARFLNTVFGKEVC